MRSSILSAWLVLLLATVCMSKVNLWQAVRNDDLNLVKQHLENGTDVKASNVSPSGLTLLMYLSKWSLTVGSLNNRKQLLELVLPASDPKAADNEGNTALMYAAREGNHTIVEMILPVS